MGSKTRSLIEELPEVEFPPVPPPSGFVAFVSFVAVDGREKLQARFG
jgi:hypothetical protein